MRESDPVYLCLRHPNFGSERIIRARILQKGEQMDKNVYNNGLMYMIPNVMLKMVVKTNVKEADIVSYL